MKLIKVENFSIQVADEAMLVKPIRKLYNQDRSSSKEQFFKQISYLYFMIDPRSTYSYILDMNERAKTIIEQEGLPKDFNAALKAAHTVSEFLMKPDILEQEDDKGKPKYQISSITSALKNVEGIVNSIQSLQKKVEEELTENDKARGSQELTIFDNVD